MANSRASVITILDELNATSDIPDDDELELDYSKTWRKSYLNNQFIVHQIEDVYKYFNLKIKYGFFVLFLLVQAALTTIHLFLVLSYNIDNLAIVELDLIVYAVIVLIALLGLFIKERFIVKIDLEELERNANDTIEGRKTSQQRISSTTQSYQNHKSGNPNNSIILSILCLFFVLLVDLTVPVYHYFDNDCSLRPTYGTFAVIACYFFFPLVKIWFPILLSIFATVCHLVVLGMITYKNSKFLSRQIISDAVYYVCINIACCFLRHLIEVMQSRMFLERYYGIMKEQQLEEIKAEEENYFSNIIIPNMAKQLKEIIYQNYERKSLSRVCEISFKEMNSFVKQYKNVTILYADIVNYTKMTSNISKVNDLIVILTELFGRFDKAAEKHNVLRIKFLGDCYYCVAGLLETPNEKLKDNHADNSVALGLDMINIIRYVRDKSNKELAAQQALGNEPKKDPLTVDMRIGIHTGTIWGGLIGKTRWHYDIWSRDVVIANKMESTGQAGKVHITEVTKNLLTKTHGDGQLMENTERKEDLEKIDFFLPTYFISPEDSAEKEVYQNLRTTRVSATNGTQRKSSARTTMEKSSVIRFESLSAKSKYLIAKTVSEMEVSKFKQWFGNTTINSFFLTFKKKSKISNMEFFNAPDPLFKFNVLAATILGLGIILLQIEVIVENLPRWDWENTLPFVNFGLLLLIILPVTWIGAFVGIKFEKAIEKKFSAFSRRTKSTDSLRSDDYMNMYRKSLNDYKKSDDVSDEFEGKNEKSILAVISDKIIKSSIVRVIIYSLTVILFSGSVLIQLDICASDKESQNNGICATSWSITLAFAIVLFVNFVFFKISVWLKFTYSFIMTGIYIFLIIKSNLLEGKPITWNHNIPSQVAHITSISFLFFILHVIDRQTEYISRLGFQWHKRIKNSQAEIKKGRTINRQLLLNILPRYIANIFLESSNRKDLNMYTNIVDGPVMFATVVHNYNVSEFDKKECIEIMNEVISKFDEILLNEFESTIVKIKVVGWTYMAAGIKANKDSLSSKMAEKSNPIIKLVDFVGRMMNALDELNRSKRNLNFKLRCGISTGRIASGVVGATKPCFDIWGDAVNLASRMDSTGVEGKIQVTENLVPILKYYKYTYTKRGEVYVKGKGNMVTYFVEPKKTRRNYKISVESSEYNDDNDSEYQEIESSYQDKQRVTFVEIEEPVTSFSDNSESENVYL